MYSKHAKRKTLTVSIKYEYKNEYKWNYYFTSIPRIFVPIFGRPFLKRFALCYQTVLCLSALSVCDVGVLCPNGCMDQDETWHAGKPRPWPHYVRWGPSSPTPKGAHSPNFRPISVVAKWLE